MGKSHRLTMDLSRLISFLCFVLLISTARTTYTDCGSELASVTSVTITDCQSSDSQCILHRNTNVTIQISFVPNEDIEEIEAVVHGVILGVPIPFDIPNPDGCHNSGLTCPLKKGAEVTYKTSLPILKKYPRVTVGVKFELQNSNSSDATCSLIPAKIQ